LPDEPDDIFATLESINDRVFAYCLVCQAETRAFLSTLEALGRNAGLSERDVAAIRAGFSAERERQIQALLLSLEDSNPSFAAALAEVLQSLPGWSK
jgi:hypothetical protein